MGNPYNDAHFPSISSISMSIITVQNTLASATVRWQNVLKTNLPQPPPSSRILKWPWSDSKLIGRLISPEWMF